MDKEAQKNYISFLKGLSDDMLFKERLRTKEECEGEILLGDAYKVIGWEKMVDFVAMERARRIRKADEELSKKINDNPEKRFEIMKEHAIEQGDFELYNGAVRTEEKEKKKKHEREKED